MSDEVIHNIGIDDRLNSYKSFFDHGWSARFIDLTIGTPMQAPAESLCVSWKASANTHVMPWLMMRMLGGLWAGLMSTHTPIAKDLIDAYAIAIPSRAGSGFSSAQQRSIERAIKDIGTEVALQVEMSKQPFDHDAVWNEFIAGDNCELALGIWGSQRICFGAVFHAYEEFVRHSIQMLNSLPSYRAHFSDLRKDLVKLFGREVADYCLNDEVVLAARLVRNTLAHNGGKVTPELEEVDHGILVDAGLLHIRAPDTVALFDALKDRALKLAAVAVAK